MDAFDKFDAHLKESGLTQDEFADQLGVSQGLVSKIKLRMQRPPLKVVLRLRDLLGIEPEEWLEAETIAERGRGAA